MFYLFFRQKRKLSEAPVEAKDDYTKFNSSDFTRKVSESAVKARATGQGQEVAATGLRSAQLSVMSLDKAQPQICNVNHGSIQEIGKRKKKRKRQ